MSETITYAKCGDYQIPRIEMEPTEGQPLGKYGRMRALTRGRATRSSTII